MKKKMTLIFTLIITLIIYGQNKQILYNFNQLPQTLLLNPGEEMTHKWHVGIPFLSGISVQYESTELKFLGILLDNSKPILEKFRDVVSNLTLKSNDFIVINQQLELFNVGFSLQNKIDFLSFGIYEELDAVFYYPKVLAELFYKGNTVLDKEYSFKDLKFRTELVSVFHVGISRKFNDDLQVGARLKVYSSYFNLQTNNNSGVYYTKLGETYPYNHFLNGMSGSIKTSGIFLPAGTEIDKFYVIDKTLLGGNLGLGVDIGFTHKPNKNLKISGSVTDLGFIYNSKDILSFKLEDNYNFEDVEPILFDFDKPDKYWNEVIDSLNISKEDTEFKKSYLSFRSTKVNAQIKYEFGEDRFVDCYDTEVDPGYFNAIGAHLFTIFRPIAPQVAATIFYERKFTRGLRAKLTYTVDSFSYTNVGFGLSAKIGVFNIYGMADNLLGYQNLAKANSASFQLGMNIIIP
ncbi:MAG: DUF5723 family protein [Flavobacteriaceae bacterium]|nr:DUF5723 family protein [Flavobacteriaceae bacterium]